MAAIFWDLENETPGSGHANSFETMANRIEGIMRDLSHLSHIVQKYVYFNTLRNPNIPRPTFEEAGSWVLRDCPVNKDNIVDMTIIVDAMTFAYENRGRNPIVVLVSGDGDYGYMLSRLSDLGIRTIVISGKDGHRRVLRRNTWFDLGTFARSSGRTGEGAGETVTVIGSESESDTGGSNRLTPAKPKARKTPAKTKARKTSKTKATLKKADDAFVTAVPMKWSSDGKVSQIWYRMMANVDKDQLRLTRNRAFEAGRIDLGFMDRQGTIRSVPRDWNSNRPDWVDPQRASLFIKKKTNL